jgi:hypothetical protein
MRKHLQTWLARIRAKFHLFHSVSSSIAAKERKEPSAAEPQPNQWESKTKKWRGVRGIIVRGMMGS